jgi:hypothetical protein
MSLLHLVNASLIFHRFQVDFVMNSKFVRVRRFRSAIVDNRRDMMSVHFYVILRVDHSCHLRCCLAHRRVHSTDIHFLRDMHILRILYSVFVYSMLVYLYYIPRIEHVFARTMGQLLATHLVSLSVSVGVCFSLLW